MLSSRALRRSRSGALAAQVASLAALASAWAETPQCNPADFKDVVHESTELAVQLSLLDTMDETNYDRSGRDVGGNIGIPIDGVPVDFGATWSSFQEKRTELFRLYHFTSNSRRSRDFVSYKLSKLGVDAYGRCLEASLNGPGLHLVPVDVAEHSFSAFFRIINKAGDGADHMVSVTIEPDGRAPLEPTTVDVPVNGSDSVTVTRDPQRGMRVTARAPVGYYDQIFVPATPKIPKVAPAPSLCQWRHGYQLTNDFNDGRLRALYPDAYGGTSEDIVKGLAKHDIYYAAGGGRTWSVNLDDWGLPKGGTVKSVEAICRNPTACQNFAALQLNRRGSREIEIFAQSNARGSVTQAEAVIEYELPGSCPPAPVVDF